MNTPTPWRIHEKTELTVVAQNNRTVANTGTYNSNIDSEKVHNENVSNAELIVRAVNYHDRLVECLKQFVDNGVAVGSDNFNSELLLHNTAQQLLTEIEKRK